MNVYKQDCSKIEQFDKVGAAGYVKQTMINTRAPDGANKFAKNSYVH